MLVKDLLTTDQTLFSFEFFPPKKDDDWDKLFKNIKQLIPLNPAYVSVTYGAGGSTRDKTHDLVVRIHKDIQIPVVSHLTCVGSSETEIEDILKEYDSHGIHNILALRGDPPKGSSEFVKPENGFEHATDLVRFIKQKFPHMGIGVAGFPEGHPQTTNRLAEIDHLKEKVNAGADYIVTQLFFDNRDFFDFAERCQLAGITVPIIAGIMPITTRKGMSRMAELSPGTRFPAPLLKGVMASETENDVTQFGIEWASNQVQELVENKVPGVHLYTLNNSRPTLKILTAIEQTQV